MTKVSAVEDYKINHAKLLTIVVSVFLLGYFLKNYFSHVISCKCVYL
jgi:hypothetical protein